MLRIIYEDSAILVVEKPPGVESQSARGFEPDMVSEIRNYLNKCSSKAGRPYVGVIHRLDKPVGGVMVYAKTSEAAAALSRQLQGHEMAKEYLAAVCGEIVDKTGVFVDKLWKDPHANHSYLVDEGDARGRRAELSYELLEVAQLEGRPVSLVRIRLVTGRHHQIRVQFAGHGHPLWGDRKYGPQPNPAPGDIALCAYRLSFRNPVTGLACTYQTEPKGEVWKNFMFHHGQGSIAII